MAERTIPTVLNTYYNLLHVKLPSFKMCGFLLNSRITVKMCCQALVGSITNLNTIKVIQAISNSIQHFSGAVVIQDVLQLS